MNVETLAGRAELAQTLQSLQQTSKTFNYSGYYFRLSSNQKDDSFWMKEAFKLSERHFLK